MFEVGDRVASGYWGEGVIIHINSQGSPIRVDHGSITWWYSCSELRKIYKEKKIASCTVII